MHPTVKAARVAGVLYLLLALIGPVSLIYVPSRLVVPGNAITTAHNIVEHETLFRIGIFCDLLTGVIGLFLALALYRLFKMVDKNLAVLMVILGGLMVTPIYFLNTVNDAAALLFARGPSFLSIFDGPQRAALAMLFLRLHHHGNLANEIFWGLWLLPFGLLVYRSQFIPRFLGIWLIVNGIAYLALSFTGLLLPQYVGTVSTVTVPALMGEMAIMLWLLIKGAKVPPAPAAAP